MSIETQHVAVRAGDVYAGTASNPGADDQNRPDSVAGPVGAVVWREVCSFFARGEPKGQPRPRAFAKRFGQQFSARVYDPGTAEGWKGCIAQAARQYLPSAPFTGPVRLDAVFFFARPQRLLARRFPDHPLPHTATPDRDNCEKALADCLKQLGMFTDDSQICDGVIAKRYTTRGGVSGASVRISVAQ